MAPRKQPAGRPVVLGLLLAVKESPDDDAPRLILADWLDDHGEPERAEFIRVQCQLARLSADAPERPPLVAREHALREQHAAKWAELSKGPGVTVQGRRGLLHLSIHPERFLTRKRQQAAETEAWAWVEAVGLISWPEPAQVATIADSPTLAHLTTLRLGGGLDGSRISYGDDRMAGAADHLKRLAESPYLGGLTNLDLSHNPLGPAGGVALAEAWRLPRLTVLDLEEAKIGDDGSSALARSPLVQNVTNLNLRYSDIGTRGALALADSPHLGHLCTLNLSINTINDAGAGAIFRSPHLANVTDLDLEHCEFGPDAVAELANTATGMRPQRLDLHRNQLGIAGMEALAEAVRLTDLTRLNLWGCDLGDESVRALATARHLGKLQVLDLGSNDLTGAGFLVLIRNLAALGLPNCRLDDVAAAALAQARGLAALRGLDLSWNEIGPTGVEELYSSPRLRQLTRFRIDGNRFGKNDRTALRQHFGDRLG